MNSSILSQPNTEDAQPLPARPVNDAAKPSAAPTSNIQRLVPAAKPQWIQDAWKKNRKSGYHIQKWLTHHNRTTKTWFSVTNTKVHRPTQKDGYEVGTSFKLISTGRRRRKIRSRWIPLQSYGFMPAAEVRLRYKFGRGRSALWCGDTSECYFALRRPSTLST